MCLTFVDRSRFGIAPVVLVDGPHQRLVDGVAEVGVPGQDVAEIEWQGKYPSGIAILKSSASGHHAVGGGDKEGSGETRRGRWISPTWFPRIVIELVEDLVSQTLAERAQRKLIPVRSLASALTCGQPVLTARCRAPSSG